MLGPSGTTGFIAGVSKRMADTVPWVGCSVCSTMSTDIDSRTGLLVVSNFNASTSTVYVIADDPYSHCALDIGCCTVCPITRNTGMITLSHYIKDRNLRTIHMKTNGSWTTSVAKMVKPSRYTKDRELKDVRIRRRQVCMNKSRIFPIT